VTADLDTLLIAPYVELTDRIIPSLGLARSGPGQLPAVTGACALSRGQDPRLFVVGQHYGGPETAQPSGRVVAFPAPAPGAGKP